MKRNEKLILKKLRREGDIITPDVLSKVYKAIGVDPTLLSNAERVIEKRLRGEAKTFVPKANEAVMAIAGKKPFAGLRALMQKPRFVSAMATGMAAIILTVTLVTLGVNGFFNVDTTDTSDSSSDAVPYPIESEREAYSIGALTTNLLLDYGEEASGNNLFYEAIGNETDGEIVVRQISPYLEMIEQLIAPDGELSVTSMASDRKGYALKDIIQASDMLGEELDYLMYYNEVAGEESETYRFVGILNVDDRVDNYAVIGSRSVEDNQNLIKFIIRYDDGDYVISRYIEGENETRFGFLVYQDGEIVSESSIRLEVQDDMIQVVLTFQSDDDLSRYKIRFREIDGQPHIDIDYHIRIGNRVRNGHVDIGVIVDEETGESQYALIIKPEGGDEEEHHEGRGHGHGQGGGSPHN